MFIKQVKSIYRTTPNQHTKNSFILRRHKRRVIIHFWQKDFSEKAKQFYSSTQHESNISRITNVVR